MSRYFDDFNTNDEILHYGVKGMKWRKKLGNKVRDWALKDNAKSHTYHTNSGRANQEYVSKSRDAAVMRNASTDKNKTGYQKKYLLEIANKYDKEAKRAKRQSEKDRKKGNRYNKIANTKMRIAKAIGCK